MAVDPDVAVLAPHPTLGAYYAGPAVKRNFLKGIFDSTAQDYDAVERLLSWGSGSWYRRQALCRAGLAPGMKVLDVAVGTGLVAREEIALTGSARLVTGIDPSAGMLTRAVQSLDIGAALGVAEQLPLESGQFDFLSMGYALRHLLDLRRTFEEFYRVLKPGGRLCVLEITTPQGRLARLAFRAYMGWLAPLLTRITTRRASSQLLWRYYWHTIDACVPPEVLLEAMTQAGFEGASRRVELRIFSEYTARKPN